MKLITALVCVLLISCACSSSALADSTLTVDQITGADTGDCQTQPCRTISYALTQASVVGGSSTIMITAGNYNEDIVVPAGADTVRLVGVGDGTDPAKDTIIIGDSTGAAVLETGAATAVSIEDMRIANPSSDPQDMVSAPKADLSLSDVVLDQQAIEGDAIQAVEGDVAFNDGSIDVEGPASAGYAISDRGGNITTNNTTITVAGAGYGLNAINGAITATHTTISLTNPNEWGFAINTLGSVTTEDDKIVVAGHGFGINAVGPINTYATTINLTNPSSYAFGVTSSSRIEASEDRVELAGEGGFAISSENVTLRKSTVALTNPATGGDAINAAAAIVANDDQIISAGNSCGAYAGTTITMEWTRITLSDTAATPCGLHAGSDLTGKHDTITDLGNDSAVRSIGNLTLADSKIVQAKTSNGPSAVSTSGHAVLENVQIDAGQTGALASNGTSTITNSTLRTAAGSTEPVVSITGNEANDKTVLLRKTSVFAGAASEPVIDAINTNLILDSTLISGGTGITYNVDSGNARTLTVTASTIDAGTPGVRDANTNSLVASVDSNPASTATVNVEDSILLEPPAAERQYSTGNVTIDCTNSETPSTSQAQAGTVGAINCPTGGNSKNSYTPNVADIFTDPAGQTYTLNPHWDGVDSIDPQTVALPDALRPSVTDAAGDARVQNAAHTCLAALQDKGAFELPGYPGTQPEPTIQLPDQIVAGIPATFTAITTNSAVLAWRDSTGTHANGTSFTDTLPTPGRYTITLVASGAAGCRQATSITITAKPDTATPLAVSATILACDHARVTLTDVAIKHKRVALTGMTEPRLAGKRVSIFSQGRVVTTAIVSHDGSFAAIAALPPAGVRLTNRARYQARIDGLRSLDLKLVRRLVLEPPLSRHGMVALEGQVQAPFTNPIAPILVWQENQNCTHARLIAKTMPDSDGHYTISLPAPRRQRDAIYRLSTSVQATITNPHRFSTFSLTEAVKLK